MEDYVKVNDTTVLLQCWRIFFFMLYNTPFRKCVLSHGNHLLLLLYSWLSSGALVKHSLLYLAYWPFLLGLAQTSSLFPNYPHTEIIFPSIFISKFFSGQWSVANLMHCSVAHSFFPSNHLHAFINPYWKTHINTPSTPPLRNEVGGREHTPPLSVDVHYLYILIITFCVRDIIVSAVFNYMK